MYWLDDTISLEKVTLLNLECILVILHSTIACLQIICDLHPFYEINDKMSEN